MKLSRLLSRLLGFYMPHIVDDDDLSGDRGDDFTPTEDDAAAKDKADEPEAGEPKGKAKPPTKKADAEEESDEADEGAGKPKPKDTRIPAKRHKEILDRERERREAAERELERLRAGSKTTETNTKITEAEDRLVELEKQHAKAVTDGDAAKAAELLTQIRRTERGIVETKAELSLQASETRAYQRARYDATLERLEDAYPEINEDHEDYDETVAAELMELTSGYAATGRYTAADALKKAAKVLLEPRTTRQKAAVDTDVRVDKGDVAAALAAERKAAAVKKAAGAAGKQPPSLKEVGQDSDKAGGQITAKQVISMSQDEFSKLDDKTLAKLRGDEI